MRAIFSDVNKWETRPTMLLIGELRLTDSPRAKKTLLDEVAALYEVDTTAIRKQVTSALEAKEAKRASSKKSRSSHRPQETATMS